MGDSGTVAYLACTMRYVRQSGVDLADNFAPRFAHFSAVIRNRGSVFTLGSLGRRSAVVSPIMATVALDAVA
jgi:hypothetical protein